MKYLLDTCIVSEYLKKNPSEKVVRWLDEQDEKTLYLSDLTIAELKKGYFKLKEQEADRYANSRAVQIAQWIHKLEARFHGRILPLSSTIFALWAKICGRSEAQGKKLPVIDSLIVATAETHAMIAVTRNERDFRQCLETLEIYNPLSL